MNSVKLMMHLNVCIVLLYFCMLLSLCFSPEQQTYKHDLSISKLTCLTMLSATIFPS